ncbi:MAG TPA: hypothetical protein VKB43_08680 [Gaiellaceae bacterium]|nr:hypothetical protein [Gaiellaceae bacterium]
MRRLALLLVVGFALAGCGGGHGGMSTTNSLSATERETIVNNWEKFFSSETAVAGKVALLQDGSRFKGLVTNFANNPLAKNVSATVSSVKLQGQDRAKVVYIVKFGGASLPKQTGTAVLQDGTWKVGSASLCKLVSLQGSTPSVCKS